MDVCYQDMRESRFRVADGNPGWCLSGCVRFLNPFGQVLVFVCRGPALLFGFGVVNLHHFLVSLNPGSLMHQRSAMPSHHVKKPEPSRQITYFHTLLL